jgi:hypothetical protein
VSEHRGPRDYHDENGNVVMTSEPMTVQYETSLLPSFFWNRETTPRDAYIRSVQTGVLFTGPLLGFNQAGLVQTYLTSVDEEAVPGDIVLRRQQLRDQFVALGRVEGRYPEPAVPALISEVEWLRARTIPNYQPDDVLPRFSDIVEPLPPVDFGANLNNYTSEEISSWFRDENG